MAVMRTTKIVFCLCLISLFVSCGEDKILPIRVEDGLYPIDRHGLVENYVPDFSKNKIYVYSTTGCVNEWLRRTTRGKIDRIISENPEWELLVYVNGCAGDTSNIRSKLNKYDCDFPVIVDTKGVFRKQNKMKECVLWGAICDRNNHLVGVGVIGDGLSVFDSEFKKVKRRMYGRNR